MPAGTRDQLDRVQRGLEPFDWKPMSSVGLGVREIRIRIEQGAFRVMYLASRPESIYVLHCLRKTTRKTARRELDLARSRFEAIPHRWE